MIAANSRLSFFLLFTPMFLQATYVGPDSFGYTGRSNTDPGGMAYQWVNIEHTGTQVIGNFQDDTIVPVTLGSVFSFYGASYATINVSTNGFIRFDGGMGNPKVNTSLPTSEMGAALLVYWDDLAARTTELGLGGVWYQYFTSSPHADMSGPVSVVMFKTNHYDYHLGVGLFEALLEHNTGRILYQYSNLWMGPTQKFGASSTVGIQQGGTGGTSLQYQMNTIYSIPDRSTILFQVSEVPEPSTFLAIGIALVAVALMRRRRRA